MESFEAGQSQAIGGIEESGSYADHRLCCAPMMDGDGFIGAG